MPNEADEADVFIDQWNTACLKNAIGVEMPKGVPGDCDICGQWSGRLVDGACAPCREKYKLP
jgi:hypothetical protein